jgi:hypothetical protein
MQAIVRGRNSRADVLRVLEAGSCIKSFMLSKRQRERYLVQRQAATNIQNHFRVSLLVL